MELSKVIAEMEKIASPSLAAPFDNGRIGLIYKGNAEVEKIAVALDPTGHAIAQAVSDGAQLLITHHTLIWNPVNKIDEALGRKLSLLISSNLSLYCAHTNWDAAPGGVNDTYAGLLGMKNYRLVDGGLAIVGKIPGNRRGYQYAEDVMYNTDGDIAFYGDPEKLTRNIVAVAGSGFRSALDIAKEAGADTVVSSEVHHDQIREAADYGINLIDVPHYHAEIPAMERLAIGLGDRLNIPVGLIRDAPFRSNVNGPRLVVS